MQTKITSALLLALGFGLGLTACVKQAVLATGSAVASTAGAAVGAAGSAASAATSSVTSGVSSLATSSTGSASATSASTSASSGTTNAASSGTPAHRAAAETAIVAGGMGVLTQQVNAGPATTPTGSVIEGTEICLNAARFRAAAAENMIARGWREVAATETAPNRSAARTLDKYGVRATILPSGSCVFRTETVALNQLSQRVYDALDRTFDGEVTVGSPQGRTGPCDGVTLKASGVNAWLYFTSETGDHCSKAGSGAGLTVKLL